MVDLAEVIFPSVCMLCDTRLPDASEPLCAACAASCEPCRRVEAGPACAPFVYRGAVREAIHHFKYGGRRRLGPWLARRMAEQAARELPIEAIDCVVGVPLHWLKRRLRGEDPVGELSRHVAARLGHPWHRRALARRRWTSSQTRLTPAQRSRNVRMAFRARPPGVAGRTVLLVDDVFTSGATARACAQALRDAGAAQVFVLTAAATPRD